MTNITRIFGPPGTGKTTRLLNIVESYLEKGMAPERIGYFSFTRKAAEEAIERACNKFKYSKSRFPYFRTLHSLAFKTLNLRPDEMMQFFDYKNIADFLGLNISEYKDEEDTVYGREVGDICMSICALARNRQISLEEEWRKAEHQIDVNFSIVQQWLDAVEDYKAKRGLHDYNDLLEQYDSNLPIDIFILDEAQDLSKLQWKACGVAFRKASEIYVAGDDDQCIFNWSGADVNLFLNYRVNSDIILPQSYRVPRKISFFAKDIVKNISNRKDKMWEPKKEAGKIYYDEELDYLPFDNNSWMLLARNTKFLWRYENHLKKLGLIYYNAKTGKNSISEENANYISGWEKLRKGEFISPDIGNEINKKLNPKAKKIIKQEIKMDDLMIPEEMKNKPWYEIFNRALKPETIEYIRSCLRNGQKLNEKPKITVSTIHRVKGGEATNVVLCPDVSYNTYQTKDSDDEHRVWYVGATRAKENLYILKPQTKMFYEF